MTEELEGVDPSDLLTIAAAAGSAVAGGFYLSFSAVVMPALRLVPPAHAVRVMNHINRFAVRLPFMTVFFGTAVAGTWVAISSAGEVGSPAALLRLAGAGLYLSGFILTIAYNVPLNNRLARFSDAQAASQWPQWAGNWSKANTVRAALSIAGALAMATSGYVAGRQ